MFLLFNLVLDLVDIDIDIEEEDEIDDDADDGDDDADVFIVGDGSRVKGTKELMHEILENIRKLNM